MSHNPDFGLVRKLYRAEIAALPPSVDTESFTIRESVRGGLAGLYERGPITIAVTGDSVSQGCFGFLPPDGSDCEIDCTAVYHDRLRRMIQSVWSSIPVNVVNAAVCGCDADFGAKKFDERVAIHRPDLVIVCFGLNDVNNPVERYTSALSTIFGKCKAIGADCVYMTPNMLNTARDESDPAKYLKYFDYALTTAGLQNGGTMDTLIDAGRATARAAGVPIADAYAIWKSLAAAGVDTSALLANFINHPTREMHELFAELLFARIFGMPHISP